MVPKPERTDQMNGLYPIIRRVRRPLLPVDWPADAKPAEVPVRNVEPAQGQTQKNKVKHGETTTSEPAQ